MNRYHHIDPWEHCPDCGAVLIQLPGYYYCSHCGFEDELVEEGAITAGNKTPVALLLDQLGGSLPMSSNRAA